MEKLQQLAFDALDEAGFGDNESKPETEVESDENENIEKRDNGDGTVTLTMAFSLDPKVVAEKAKAMKKGVKREDLSDELVDESEGDGNDMVYADDQDPEPDPDSEEDEDEDPYNGVNVEDSLFQDVLDSIDGVATMDARKNSRHAQTPIENCRAKDPRFCPYHGQLAWQNYLEGELKNAGMSGASVSLSNENGKFTATVEKVGLADVPVAEKILNDLMAVNGVKHEANPVSHGVRVAGENQGDYVEGEFKTDWKMTDRVGMLNEWVDDFMADNVATGADVDMNDLNDLLEAQETLETFQQSMNDQDPNDVAKFNTLLADAQQKYHTLKAQQDFYQVKGWSDADNEATTIANDYTTAQTKFHGEQQTVKDAKTAIFGGRGAFPSKTKKNPVSFQDSHPWAKRYNSVASGIGRAEADYDKAFAAYQQAASDYQQGTVNIKALRAALAEMQYQAENFENRADVYPRAQKQFLQDFYDWAQSENHPNLSAAFPNGRPQ